MPHFPIPAFSRVQVVRDDAGGWSERPIPCPHRRAYRRGSPFVCMICHRSGKDHLKALQRTVASDPRPTQAPEPEKPKVLTRKEKRALRRDYKLREDSLTTQERDYLRGLGVDL